MDGTIFTVKPTDTFGDHWEAKLHTGILGTDGFILERGTKRECYDAIEKIQKAETYEGKLK